MDKINEVKRYKVLTTSVGALNNKIFRYNDIVPSNAWKPGTAEELEKLGFLEEVKDTPQPPLPDPTPDPVKEITINTPIEDLRAELIKLGIPFRPDLSKNELFSLYKKNKPAKNDEKQKAGEEHGKDPVKDI